MLGGLLESVKSFFDEMKDLSTPEKIAILGAFAVGLFLGFEASRGFSDLILAISSLTKRKVKNGGKDGS